MIDFHIHSLFSPDSYESLDAIARTAIEKHMSAIAITDHIDLYMQSDFTHAINYELYFDAIEGLRRMNSNLYIAIGIEAGYDKTSEAVLTRLFEKYPFDYIINSVHIDDYCEPKEYLEKVLESLHTPYYYSAVGHLGEPVRRNDEFNILSCPALLDEILRTIIAKNKILEINSSLHGASLPHLPCPAVLERYRELGGELVTFGSDAHFARRIGKGYEAVTKKLRSLGFKALAYEKSRKLELYEL